jgi:hypothetical protein
MLPMDDPSSDAINAIVFGYDDTDEADELQSCG